MKVNQRVNGIWGQEEKCQHEPAQRIKTAWVTQMCGATKKIGLTQLQRRHSKWTGSRDRSTEEVGRSRDILCSNKVGTFQWVSP